MQREVGFGGWGHASCRAAQTKGICTAPKRHVLSCSQPVRRPPQVNRCIHAPPYLLTTLLLPLLQVLEPSTRNQPGFPSPAPFQPSQLFLWVWKE